MKRDKMFSKGMHPRLGWCKKGDWNGRLPKGSKGAKWNAPCDCERPSTGAWLHKEGIAHTINPQDSEILVGWYQNSQVDTWKFVVPCECGEEAVLYYRNNCMTGKRGWW